MGLKQRKKVHNQYAEGKETFMNRLEKNGGGIAQNAIGFAGSTINSFGPVKSQSDLMQESGQSVGLGSGFQYQRQNSINAGEQMSELSRQNTANTLDNMGKGAALGASVGSLFPGLGTVIGGVAGGLIGGVVGLFGGASRQRKLRARIRAAQTQVENNNSYNLASAQSDYLQNQYNLDHENTQDDQLFAAKHGKDLVQPIRNK